MRKLMYEKSVKAFVASMEQVSGIKGDDSTRATVVPSGFKGLWVAVFEDVDYTLGARYLKDEEVERLGLRR